MTIEKFKEILNRPEGPTLDFKREQYDLLYDKEGINAAKFIKDVVSFANTVRRETAYIIIGVEENNGQKKLLGLDKLLDDSILQDKMKDKVYPKPKFHFYSIEFDEKRFGIIEIPIIKYSEPICLIRNFKGLETGKVYIRRGSMNGEASISEIIETNDWFRRMKSNLNESELLNKITGIISYLNTPEFKLSKALSDTLKVAHEIEDKELILFCTGELLGWENKVLKEHKKKSEVFLAYRICRQIVSPYEFSIQPTNSDNIKIFEHIKEYESSFEMAVLTMDSIPNIEEHLEEFKRLNFNVIIKRESSLRKVYPNAKSKDRPMYIYSNYNIMKNLYIKCKLQLQKELIERI